MQRRSNKAFSLVELVIVVVILGIIGAIALPRMSRGAAGAGDSALTGDLRILRSAIELYATEHDSVYPSKANIISQLTKYSDDQGVTSNTKSGNYVFGPYLRVVPLLPVSANKGANGIGDANGIGVGWVYDETTGTISANAGAAVDAKGAAYVGY